MQRENLAGERNLDRFPGANFRLKYFISNTMETSMRKLFCLGAVLIGLFLMPEPLLVAQLSAQSAIMGTTNETLLSGNDWKLGSFPMDEGEKRGAFVPGFDDHEFRMVEVPGEVQQQIGLRGMDLYYQSKTLSLINKKEWWYRKRFTVSKRESGKLLRLIFHGVDYFASVWLNGQKLGDHEGSYVPFSYNVTGKIRLGHTNLLAVKVTCPWLPKGRGFLEYMKGD